MFDERYKVERADYKNFIETFNAKFRRVEEEKNDEEYITKVFSINNDKCLAARVSCGNKPEQYYIFEFPSPQERVPPILKRHVILNDIKQVQAFFEGLQKMQELNNHD